MITTLRQALPAAEFTEHHELTIDATPDAVWHSLQTCRWSDLRWSKPLFLARGLGLRRSAEPAPTLMDERGPTPLLHVEPGRYLAGGRIARPWKLRPELGPAAADLDGLAAPVEGSWLRFGMDLELIPLPGGRTRLITETRCEPTDEAARRRFARYWRLIRPFSGLIRHDLLNAVARRAGR